MLSAFEPKYMQWYHRHIQVCTYVSIMIMRQHFERFQKSRDLPSFLIDNFFLSIFANTYVFIIFANKCINIYVCRQVYMQSILLCNKTFLLVKFQNKFVEYLRIIINEDDEINILMLSILFCNQNCQEFNVFIMF